MPKPHPNPSWWPMGAALDATCAGSSDAQIQWGQVGGEGARGRGDRCVTPVQMLRWILSSVSVSIFCLSQMFFALVLPFKKNTALGSYLSR